MHPQPFTYHAPGSLDEALGLLAEHGDEAKLLAGGHSLLPTMKLRLAAPQHLIDMRHLAGALRYVRDEGDALAIGALATHHTLASDEAVRAKAPVLAATAAHVGDMQVRNRGTLGGSLAHADPAGDLPAAALAADATLVIRGPEGERRVAAAEFFTGMFATAVGEGEILTEVRVPLPQGGSAYAKYYHPASGYAVAGVAVVISADGDAVGSVRIGVTGVSDVAYRATGVEEALTGRPFGADAAAQVAERVTEGVEPLADTFADAEYRAQLARVQCRRALLEAWSRA